MSRLKKLLWHIPGYDSELSHQDDTVGYHSVKARYGIQGDYILHIGRVQPRKNLQRLINAFKALLAHHPHLKLVLAGPMGWLSEPIREHVRQLATGQTCVISRLYCSGR